MKRKMRPLGVDPSLLVKNLLLSGLPRDASRRLLPNMEIVHLSNNDILAESGEPIAYCYFPLSAVLGLVADLEEGVPVGVGLIGEEGMMGIRVILGRSTGANRAVVLSPGAGLRIPSKHLVAQFNQSTGFRNRLLHYVRYMLAQFSQTGACNRIHLLEQRFCRWVLSFHDRVKSPRLVITQGAVADVLGAPRTEVCRIIASLKKRGLIDTGRRGILLKDRKGLESRSCECYWIIKYDYSPIDELTAD